MSGAAPAHKAIVARPRLRRDQDRHSSLGKTTSAATAIPERVQANSALSQSPSPKKKNPAAKNRRLPLKMEADQA